MERTRRVRLFSSYFEIAVTTKMLQESWRNGCNCGKSYVKIRSRQLDYTCFHKYRFERWKVWRKELSRWDAWNASNVFKDIFRLDRGQTSFPQLFPQAGKKPRIFLPISLSRTTTFSPSFFLEVFPGHERVLRVQESPARRDWGRTCVRVVSWKEKVMRIYRSIREPRAPNGCFRIHALSSILFPWNCAWEKRVLFYFFSPQF